MAKRDNHQMIARVITSLHWYIGYHARYVAHGSRGVTLTSQVFRQHNVSGSEMMYCPVSQPYFHFTGKRDAVLASWRSMPLQNPSLEDLCFEK